MNSSEPTNCTCSMDDPPQLYIIIGSAVGGTLILSIVLLLLIICYLAIRLKKTERKLKRERYTLSCFNVASLKLFHYTAYTTVYIDIFESQLVVSVRLCILLFSIINSLCLSFTISAHTRKNIPLGNGDGGGVTQQSSSPLDLTETTTG